jgi:glycosyltransferase involved in cell wall biosynthesis
VNALSASVGGAITVARSLTRAMAELRPGHRFLLLCSLESVGRDPLAPNVERACLPFLTSPLRRTLWEQLMLPFWMRRRAVDVVLSLGGFSSFTSGVPQVSVWQNPNIMTRLPIPRPLALQAFIRVQRLAQSASLRKAHANVFLTQDSLQMARGRWPMERFPHVVIHSGIDPERVVPKLADAGSGRERLALSVGHTYFHKNYEVMIDAGARYRDRFGELLPIEIIGGAVDESYHQKLQARIDGLGLGDVVRMAGEVPADRVASRMRHAAVYVVTSLLETFGLTVLEAMANGTPVVASNATCLPEVCGGAALLCDPGDPEDVADKLHRVVSDPDLQRELRSRGFERVRHFSWERAARAYLEELERVAVS